MLLILQGIPWALDFGPWIVIAPIKFLISAFFYISLVMLCSYYGKSGRTALVSSYVLLAAYGLANYIGWIIVLNLIDSSAGAASDLRIGYLSRSSGYQTNAGFELSFVETMHCCQSVFLGIAYYVVSAIASGQGAARGDTQARCSIKTGASK